jgi:outer membrane protein insertion porin family
VISLRPFAVLVCALLLLWSGVVRAGAPVPAEGEVTRVTVEGTRRIDEAAVLAAVGLRRGERLTPQKVRRDLKAVYETGWFQDVVIELRDTDDGVAVVFVVEEKPAIREVKIEGNKKIDEEDIREVLDVRGFSVLNTATIKDNIEAIRDLYIEKGFYLAEIEAEPKEVGDQQVDVIFTVTENRKVVVQRIDLTGNDHVADRKIKRFLQIKEGGIAPWLTSTGNFDRDLLDADVETVRFVFLEEGFVDVQVDAPKVYLSPDKRFIFISYNITEGEQYDLGKIDVQGDFLPELGLTRDAAMQIVNGRAVADIQEEQWRSSESKKKRALAIESRGPKLIEGARFKASTLHQVMAHIQGLYEDQGFAFVNIIPQTLPHPEDQTVDVTFYVETGDMVRIGRINITGNDPTFDKIVRREVLINEGEIYRGSLIKASRARLERLGFFDEVNISTPRGDGPEVLDLNIQVSEQPTGSFSLGMGYSNLESFVLTANVSKNNFLGLGYTMSAAINWSSLRRDLNLSLFDPHFLDSRWSLLINLFSRSHSFQLDQFERGATVGVGRYLDIRDDVQLRLDYSISDVGLNTISPFQQHVLSGDLYRSGLTSSVGADLSVDKRNNRIFPTQGWYWSMNSSLSGGFRVNDEQVLSLLGGEFHFIENQMNLRVYKPLIKDSDQLVLRFNTSLGVIANTDGRVIPLIHRYRAGGINSVRGYQWFSLGPTVRALNSDDAVHSDAQLTVGGTQTWVNNIELESPVIRAAGIKAVLFFDAGNAFGDPWGGGYINPFGLRAAYGAGIRWQSPIGPLRFEYGFPINPLEHERKSVFDFSIGSFF